jgi:ABC-type glycerol-3-phosphate transport system permease component
LRAPWPLIFTRTLVYVILVAIVIVEAFPLMWMILTSVKESHEVFNTLLPAEIKWQNFSRVWFAMNFPVHLGNSLYVTSLTVALVVAVATRRPTPSRATRSPDASLSSMPSSAR